MLQVLAEKAAWDFVKEEGGSMELTTILPVAVFGPVSWQHPPFLSACA